MSAGIDLFKTSLLEKIIDELLEAREQGDPADILTQDDLIKVLRILQKRTWWMY